jgi:hypothetical protein
MNDHVTFEYQKDDAQDGSSDDIDVQDPPGLREQARILGLDRAWSSAVQEV